MDTNLSAEIRSETGKGAARKARMAGKLPGVLYGVGEPTSVTVDPKAFDDIFRLSQNRNTIVNLQVGEKTVPTLVKDVQRHPVSRKMLHVDFYQVEPGKPIEVLVKVLGEGRPEGAAMGGRLRVIRRDLRVRCMYDKIPESFVVDVSAMNVGDMVTASQIPTPDGVAVVYDNDFNVLTVYGKRGA
jgi:large subunit ribosomal protein L25